MSRSWPARPTHAAALLAAVLMLLLAATGCGARSSQDSKTLVVATHDSWAMDKGVMADFTRRTGIKVRILPEGDAGELTNKLVLTKDSPVADGVYGIDNTFATRAADEGVLAGKHAPLPKGAQQFTLPGKAGEQLTPIDYGDVCVNVDDSWFAKAHRPVPRTLDDLVKPEYKNLFVTPGATTSSPGLAFLLTTVAAKGRGWQDYWKKLVANGAKIDAGWTDAWETDFTAGGGKGDRPIVLSYSSSPPDTIPDGATKPAASALLDTCYRQVEYAGVLQGSRNPAGMKKFIAFMQSRKFQAALPENMYVYPVDRSVALPKDWSSYAQVSPHPYRIDPAQVTAHRATWLRQWRDIVSG